MGEFEGKVAVVTGATSGIGLAIAKKLSDAGARVALCGRDRKKLDQVAQTLPKALCLQADVSSVADLEKFYETVHKQWGRVDIVVANAGIASRSPLEAIDEQFFDEMVSINFKGLYFTVQKALPFLKEPASILLISSTAAHLGVGGHSLYSATKAAVSHLVRTFSAELVGRGIRVNALSPGPVDTPIFDGLRRDDPQGVEELASRIPVKRFAQAEEIADAACFLLSSRSSFIVGADLVIDGGMSAISF